MSEATVVRFAFCEGDMVVKSGGDYYFRGVVVSAFRKRSGVPRYVVENADGILHIFNQEQLEPWRSI